LNSAATAGRIIPVTGTTLRQEHFREFLRSLEPVVGGQPPSSADPALVHAVFDSVTEGIFICDPKMRLLSFNRAAEEITGFARHEVMGKECVEVCSGKLCGAECAVCQTLLTRRPVRDAQLKFIRKDGQARLVQLNTSMLQGPEGHPAAVVVVFRDMTELVQLRRELRERYRFHGLVGKSPRMQAVYELVESLAETDSTVLIQGESGTGKELIAAALHYEGPRSRGPFVRVGCGALPPGLLESELFGHVKGAFTGAIRDKAGRFELAHRGTIFLDDVSEIPLDLQARLLRVLQERTVERVGDTRTVQVDVRIVAATNRDLAALVGERRFREDVYYRLNVVPVSLPPLRERRDDIPLLVDHFINLFNSKMKRKVEGVSPEAMRLLADYSWPGNVRELENAVEHAFVSARGSVLTPDDLPAHLSGAASPQPRPRVPSRETLLGALRSAGWNTAEAGRAFAVHRTTVWRWMKRFKISSP
jgi:PAS domain S-box-containing protein